MDNDPRPRLRLNPRIAAPIREFARKRGLREGAAATFLLTSALEREGFWPPKEDPPKETPEPR